MPVAGAPAGRAASVSERSVDSTPTVAAAAAWVGAPGVAWALAVVLIWGVSLEGVGGRAAGRARASWQQKTPRAGRHGGVGATVGVTVALVDEYEEGRAQHAVTVRRGTGPRQPPRPTHWDEADRSVGRALSRPR